MPDVPSASAFAYLILRVVPSLARGERFNVGVVLFCRQRDFLGASIEISPVRLAALSAAVDPRPDLDELSEHLAALVRVAEGAPGGGPIAALPPSERFGWLAAPASTAIQPSEVHAGLCVDPAETLRLLHRRLVS